MEAPPVGIYFFKILFFPLKMPLFQKILVARLSPIIPFSKNSKRLFGFSHKSFIRIKNGLRFQIVVIRNVLYFVST